MRPAGLFFDAKGQAIYVTVENRLLEIDVGPITFSLPVNPVTIVNVANQTVKVSSPNTLIDDLPGFEDGTTRGDAILRGPQGIGGRILGGDPESPCGIEGCLIVADRENRRLRLVGPDGVVTAVGDGNFVCNGAPDYPKLSETVGPINPDGSPAPPPPPCSADGKVPMSVDGFMDPVEVGGLGGWARWPENLAEMVYPDGWPMMIADVDMPMQVAVDVAQDFNGDPSRPPFHIWFTERTSSGSLLRVIDQDGYIMTMANPGMADMPPPMEFSDPTIEGTESTATMPPPPQIRSFSLAGKRMMFVMEDGHLGRVELSYSASMDPGFIEEGYNPDAPYATEDVRKRRR